MRGLENLTVASAERSFSKLNIIKTDFMRSTIMQDRLNDLGDKKDGLHRYN